VAMLKKARKYPTSEAVNENPSFEVIMTQSYANGYLLVSLLYKVSINLRKPINISNKPLFETVDTK